MEQHNLGDSTDKLRAQLNLYPGFEKIVGRSSRLLRVLEMAARVANRDSAVLILGETGSGRSLLASAIHMSSARRDRGLQVLNCGDLKDGLGVAETKWLEHGQSGTVLLNEVSELPLSLQLKLLQFLEYGEANPPPAFRVIATSRHKLRALVSSGAFREDLYYRLSVVPLELPPLRERKEDLPDLVQHLFAKTKDRLDIDGIGLSPSLSIAFARYDWPGNIRELENVIERILVLAPGPELSEADVPPELWPQDKKEELALDLPDGGLSLSGLERELLVKALEKFRGNQTKAARYLQISRRTLIYRMEKYKIRGSAAHPAGAHLEPSA